MANGYHGKILHVDLTHGSFEIEQPADVFYRKYMGGSAIGAYYLLKHTPPSIDPFDPENALVIATSVLTGAPVQGASRVTLVAKSPLTNAIGDSQCGGFFPAELKFAGFDAIVIRGQSPSPVYLNIHDGSAEIRSAEHLWGRTTGEVEDEIRNELNDEKVQILQTGIAGENLVRFSAMIHRTSRANGRTGLGAVAGSKRLKAIAVRGSQKPKLADKQKLHQLARLGVETFPDSGVYSLGMLGTASIVRAQNASGGLPTRNWTGGGFEEATAIDGQTMDREIVTGNDTCYACSVRCKRVVEANHGPLRVDPRYGGPEYETLAFFGSMCGIHDLATIAYANQLCNQFGIDTISCGSTIAWAMECFELGLIDRKDTGDVELRFGDGAAMVKIIEMIARREGFGSILAEGSARAAAVLGRGTEELLTTVKGQEMPAHMPQVKRSLGLIYAVNPFGPDHESSAHDPTYPAYPERMAQLGLVDPQPSKIMNEEKVKFTFQTQRLFSCLDTLNICVFVFGPAFQLFSPNQLVEAVSAVSGWEVTIEELLTVGERRLNMMRFFNAQAGFTKKDDQLPKKLFRPLDGGASDGITLSIEEMEWAKARYYEIVGWDSLTGNPTEKKLKSLGLDWLNQLCRNQLPHQNLQKIHT